nr:DEAD/DEAH box helicase [Pseudenhygromyxa sp. WMMC2535]
MPRSRENLLAKASPSQAQLRVHELELSLAELRKLDNFSRRAPRIRARLAHDLLAALAQAQAQDELELIYADLPISATTQPWQPALRLSPAPAQVDGEGPPRGQLSVAWNDALLDRWLLEPAIVLRRAGVLSPLAEGVPEAILRRVGEPPVIVDAASFDALARGVLADAAVPVEIPEPEQIGATAVARREPRVYLEERREVLRVRGKLAYELSDGRCVEIDGEDRSTLTLGEALTLVRERRWEQARWAELEAEVGASRAANATGVELVGEEAWQFLCGGLASLREAGWSVFGEANLAHNRVASEPLTPRPRLGPSTDWFELEVDFETEGQRLPGAEVIASWLAGERFVRIADERVAALPQRWLTRHGPALAELLELQRSAGEQGLGAHALPLAAELLGELDLDADPEQQARASHWRRRARELLDFEGVADRPPPAALQAELRPYQRRGLAWLCFLRDRGLGGCLADDMGLGKTLQALALVLDTHASTPAGPPSLVVCPTSVLPNWREQAARFAPQLRVHLHHGARRGELPAEGEVDLILTSYALLRQDIELLQARRFRHGIFDEAQALKNPDSQLARAARTLELAHPLALTGTPLENDLLELWSLFELLMPGFFGPRARFRRRWVEPIHKREDAATLARLRRRLRPFMLRRLKREVAHELPPKQTQVLRCRLSKDQRAIYERVRQTYRSSVLGAVDQKGLGGASLHILEALTRLRQACCHPALLPFPEIQAEAGAVRSAKIDLLVLLLREAITGGHRSLVFSQWPSFLDHVARALDDAKLAYLRLDGRTRDRAAVLERWRGEAGPPVFLISTKAGGLGLNLSEADHVFHLDPWWNPAAEDQASDRAHRIGQTRPVMVYKLVAADTLEDKILELQARKRRLFRATVDADRLQVDALSREDLEAVFADNPLGSTSPGEVGELDDFDELAEREGFTLDDDALADPIQPGVRPAEFIPLAREQLARRTRELSAEDGDDDEDEDQDEDEDAVVLELFPKRR